MSDAFALRNPHLLHIHVDYSGPVGKANCTSTWGAAIFCGKDIKPTIRIGGILPERGGEQNAICTLVKWLDDELKGWRERSVVYCDDYTTVTLMKRQNLAFQLAWTNRNDSAHLFAHNTCREIKKNPLPYPAKRIKELVKWLALQSKTDPFFPEDIEDILENHFLIKDGAQDEAPRPPFVTCTSKRKKGSAKLSLEYNNAVVCMVVNKSTKIEEAERRFRKAIKKLARESKSVMTLESDIYTIITQLAELRKKGNTTLFFPLHPCSLKDELLLLNLPNSARKETVQQSAT